MALRLASLRRFCAGSAPRLAGLRDSVMSAGESVKGFSFSKFYEEKHFWEKANVGPLFLLLLFTPTIYRSVKDAYWTRQLRILNTEEVVSDRYEWLRLNMLKDEV